MWFTRHQPRNKQCNSGLDSQVIYKFVLFRLRWNLYTDQSVSQTMYTVGMINRRTRSHNTSYQYSKRLPRFCKFTVWWFNSVRPVHNWHGNDRLVHTTFHSSHTPDPDTYVNLPQVQVSLALTCVNPQYTFHILITTTNNRFMVLWSRITRWAGALRKRLTGTTIGFLWAKCPSCYSTYSVKAVQENPVVWSHLVLHIQIWYQRHPCLTNSVKALKNYSFTNKNE